MRRYLFILVALVMFTVALAVAGCKKGEMAYAPSASAPMAAPAPGEMVPPEAKQMWMEDRSMAAAAEGAPADAPAAPPPAGVASDKPSQAIKPKIIRTGSATLRTQDIEADTKKIEDKVKTLNGYVAASTQDSSNELNKTANLTIKIPAEHFDGFMGFIKTAFKVAQIQTNSEDVGEEYVDVESRLANFRLEEKRLLDLLDKGTGKLEDILNVERELARVREEIERMTGRLRYLDNRVGYSTITISLVQSKEMEAVESSWTAEFWHNVKQTLLDGIELFGGALRGLFLVVVGGLPFWAIIAVVAWLVIRVRRKRKLQQAAPPLPPKKIE